MLHTTKGIVFHTTRFSETSLVVKIYTQLFGLQSYLVKGVHSPRSRFKPGLFQPLTLLDLVVYHKERITLQSVKEVHLAHPYISLPFDIRKSTQALFLNELIYKAVREEEPNPDLFEFFWSSFTTLDQTEEPVAFFHIHFALQLMHHLGIFPQDNYSDHTPWFNLREGMFQAEIPGHTQYLDRNDSRMFHTLLNMTFPVAATNPAEAGTPDTGATTDTHIAAGATDPRPPIRAERPEHFDPGVQTRAEQSLGTPEPDTTMSEARHTTIPSLNNPTQDALPSLYRKRSFLLDTILLYYQLHLPGFKGVRSHHVLHTVLA